MSSVRDAPWTAETMGTWPGTRAPRGTDEIAAVLAGRPPGWEYLYFAGNLLAGRDAAEERFQTPVAGSAPPGDQIDDQAAVDYLQRALADIQQVVASLTPLVAPDVLAAAFGLPGQAGDPVRIRQLADHWNAGVRSDARLGGNVCGWPTRSDTYRALFELAGRLVDRPVREYHDFVDEFLARVDRIPAALAAGAPLDIGMTLSLDVDDAVLTAFTAKLDALELSLPEPESPPRERSAVAVAGPGRPAPWGGYGFYLVLLVAGVGGSLAAGYQGDLFWLAIAWGLALGVMTRILGLSAAAVGRPATLARC